MVMLYVLMVEKGLRTLDQVPSNLRTQVSEIYKTRNQIEGGI